MTQSDNVMTVGSKSTLSKHKIEAAKSDDRCCQKVIQITQISHMLWFWPRNLIISCNQVNSTLTRSNVSIYILSHHYVNAITPHKKDTFEFRNPKKAKAREWEIQRILLLKAKVFLKNRYEITPKKVGHHPKFVRKRREFHTERNLHQKSHVYSS